MLNRSGWIAGLSLFAASIFLFCTAAWLLEQGYVWLVNGLAALSAVVAIFAIGVTLDWLLMWVSSNTFQWNLARTMTPRLRELEAAGRLTAEQAATVPGLSYRAEFDLVAGESGPIFYLRTQSGSIPFVFVEDMVKDSGIVYLRSIRSFSEGTPQREYARLLTEWCIQQGLATPANGNQPAMWINEQARGRAARMLGMDLNMEME